MTTAKVASPTEKTTCVSVALNPKPPAATGFFSSGVNTLYAWIAPRQSWMSTAPTTTSQRFITFASFIATFSSRTAHAAARAAHHPRRVALAYG